jgi:hypothetical protein
MDIQQLKAAKDQLADVERQVLEDIKAKAALLGYELIQNGVKSEPKQKRKRRTKAEIETDQKELLPRAAL